MRRNVSNSRKLLFNLGTGLSVIGMLVFFAGFFIVILSMGHSSNADFSWNMGQSRGFDPIGRNAGLCWVGGMVLMILGNATRAIGARGVAGSGAVLDPEQARRDLEPFSRQAGGMLKDVLDEADIAVGSPPAPVIMVRCRACSELNNERARFCQACGQPL